MVSWESYGRMARRGSITGGFCGATYEHHTAMANDERLPKQTLYSILILHSL